MALQPKDCKYHDVPYREITGAEYYAERAAEQALVDELAAARRRADEERAKNPIWIKHDEDIRLKVDMFERFIDQRLPGQGDGVGGRFRVKVKRIRSKDVKRELERRYIAAGWSSFKYCDYEKPYSTYDDPSYTHIESSQVILEK
ncbi:MAG: hypothetical protein ABIG71_00105 [Candidatus Uhrbacteria bacterium]